MELTKEEMKLSIEALVAYKDDDNENILEQSITEKD